MPLGLLSAGEAKLPGRDLLALKLGRQEFNYGSTFILGPNSFYDGLAFDAARMRIKPSGKLSLDFLGGYYATAFNNGMRDDLEGAYASYSFSDADAVEGYFFRDTGSAVHHHGKHLDIRGAARCRRPRTSLH